MNTRNDNESAVIAAANGVSAFECEDLFEFLNRSESWIAEEYNRHDEWVRPNASEHRSFDFGSTAADGYLRFGGQLPSVLRAMVFIYAYGRFEYSMHTLCKLLQAVFGARCGPEDLKGKGLQRSRTYIEKVIGIEWTLPAFEAMKEASVYGALRNAVVHNNGVLPEREKEAERYIKSKPGIVMNQDRVLEFEAQFVVSAMKRLEEAWSLVHTHAAQIVEARGPDVARTAV